MDIKRVTVAEYGNTFDGHTHIYNTTPFLELNTPKCDEVHYLIFHDTKPRLGIALGVNHAEQLMSSPFSAPFGGFAYKEEPRLEVVEQALMALREYCKGFMLKLILPPVIYGSTFNAKIVSALSRMGINPCWVDLNYHYDLSRWSQYEEFLARNARKNLNNSLKAGFEFQHLDSSLATDVKRAYAVIQSNRTSHGYPLRMSLDDVLQTIKIVDADFFVVSLNGEDIAAAQVFKPADGIAQVIYWGDAPGYSTLRPMNFLAREVCGYYYRQGLQLLDIGPSTEHGTPNYGLCEFKENIGCEISLKYIYCIARL